MKIYLYGPVKEPIINAYNQYLNAINKMTACSEERVADGYRAFQATKAEVESLIHDLIPLHIWQEDEYDKLFTDEKTKALFMNGLRSRENWLDLVGSDTSQVSEDLGKALTELFKPFEKEDRFLFWNMN